MGLVVVVVVYRLQVGLVVVVVVDARLQVGLVVVDARLQVGFVVGSGGSNDRWVDCYTMWVDCLTAIRCGLTA